MYSLTHRHQVVYSTGNYEVVTHLRTEQAHHCFTSVISTFFLLFTKHSAQASGWLQYMLFLNGCPSKNW